MIYTLNEKEIEIVSGGKAKIGFDTRGNAWALCGAVFGLGLRYALDNGYIDSAREWKKTVSTAAEVFIYYTGKMFMLENVKILVFPYFMVSPDKAGFSFGINFYHGEGIKRQ